MSIYSIYKIVNNVNGKVYVGFATNFKRRMSEHLKNSENLDYTIYRAIRKHGKANFSSEIIYQSLDGVHCKNVMEKHFISEYDSYHNGYNETMGGDGILGLKHTEESKNKMRKPLSESHKNNLSVSHSGKILSLEHKQNISKSIKGKNKNWKKYKTYKFISPEGEEIVVNNLTKFCKINSLNQNSMIGIYLGRYGCKTHKGYSRSKSVDEKLS
jgi:group I intron endonuclease